MAKSWPSWAPFGPCGVSICFGQIGQFNIRSMSIQFDIFSLYEIIIFEIELTLDLTIRSDVSNQVSILATIELTDLTVI